MIPTANKGAAWLLQIEMYIEKSMALLIAVIGKVLHLYSPTQSDGFSSALQPNPWQVTHPTFV